MRLQNIIIVIFFLKEVYEDGFLFYCFLIEI